MSAIAFDTHRIVKKLKEVGFSDLQAEAVTDVLGESRAPVIDVAVLATKADLSRMKEALLKTAVVVALFLQAVLVVGAVVLLKAA